ncbi:MAG: hypothetical protein K0Q55_1944 [Verrucomicrobia bacterium]|jgi:hypothetical protein|nr:hypothetical protein [Verrucomicrobiota bacterium]
MSLEAAESSRGQRLRWRRGEDTAPYRGGWTGDGACPTTADCVCLIEDDYERED